MSGQHTPGPWEYTKAASSGDRGIHAEGTGIFAEAFADIRRAGENNSAEALANARLIAAAPDLLEALRWAAQNADQSEAGRDDDWYAGLDRVRAAIAKAEGRS
jgi:hypothetical protein